MTRPKVTAEVVSAITEAAPKRLVRKLDKSPAMAEDWDWSGSAGETVSVRTASGETVSLSGGAVLREADAVRCTCLLSPKCLHVLAVVCALPLCGGAEDAPQDAPSDGLPSEDSPQQASPGDDEAIALSEPQRRVAARLTESVGELLLVGAHGCGAAKQAMLLRVSYEAKAAGLPRASAAALRVAEEVRALQRGDDGFSLAELRAAIHEALDVARLLSEGAVAHAAIGAARRTYEAAGNLRLRGLFAEPVLTRTGYAGTTVYFAHGKRRLATVSNVLPGSASRALGAYEAGLDIGASALSAAEAARTGLFVEAATMSPDGRLGRGRSVSAARASGASWFEESLAELWRRPLREQVKAVEALRGVPPLLRPAGWDLLFVDATVLGHMAGSGALALQSSEEFGSMRLRGDVALDDEAVRYRENLATLARAPGLRLRFIGRLHEGRPGALSLLACAPAPEPAGEAPRLELPEAFGGRASLGHDLLLGGYFSERSTVAPVVPSPALAASSPLLGVQRVLGRVAMGGVAVLRDDAATPLGRESVALRAAMMPTAAEVLAELVEAANPATRDWRGHRESTKPADLAAAWSRLSRFEGAAQRALDSALWLREGTEPAP